MRLHAWRNISGMADHNHMARLRHDQAGGLRQAGHQLSVIEDAKLFQQALSVASFDIVLADLSEAQTIDPLVATARSQPKALYVEYPTGSTKALASQFMCELKAGDRVTRFLDRIEDEMKTRRSHTAAIR